MQGALIFEVIEISGGGNRALGGGEVPTGGFGGNEEVVSSRSMSKHDGFLRTNDN